MSYDENPIYAKKLLEFYDLAAEVLPGYYIPFFGSTIKDDDVRGRKTSILNLIYNKNRCTMGSIKKKFNVSAGQATKLINPLVEEKLIERQVGKEDRRKVYLVLTEKGKKQIEDLINRIIAQINLVLGILEEDEKETMLKIMNKLLEGIKETIPLIKKFSKSEK